MTSSIISDDSTFRCPVCRASQTMRAVCRRCQADLGLAVRAYRRREFVIRKRAEAIALGDRERERVLTEELRWLSPSAIPETN